MSGHSTVASTTRFAEDEVVLSRWFSSLRIVDFCEYAFTTTLLLLTSGAFITLFVHQDEVEDLAMEGDPLLRIIWTVAYLGVAALVVLRWQYVRQALPRMKLIGLFLFFIAVSASWSQVPDLSMRRIFALLGTTLFGLYFGTRYSVRDQLRFLYRAVLIGGLFSFGAGALFPDFGRSALHQGAWRGVFAHKNNLGFLMAVGALVIVTTAMTDKLRIRSRAALLLTVVLLVLADARTSQMVLLLILVLLAGYIYIERTRKIVVLGGAALAVIAAGAVWIASNLEAAFGFIGKDVSLTGRIPLWLAIANIIIPQHPWVGYGYSGFWIGQTGDSGDVLALIRWPAPHAHNGFLQIAIDLGFVGLAMFLVHYFWNLRDTVRAVRMHATVECVWPAMFLVFLFLHNFTENFFINQNAICWVLYIAVTASLARNRSRISCDGRQ